jgi:hypothetical protein
MSTLARINGEALSVPGLRFWGRRMQWGKHSRVGIYCGDERGAVEVWTIDTPVATDVGGVEIHSPVNFDPPRWSADGTPDIEHCEIIGGPCWTDGSSLAFLRDFLPMIQAANSKGVLRELAAWHESHFGGQS